MFFFFRTPSTVPFFGPKGDPYTRGVSSGLSSTAPLHEAAALAAWTLLIEAWNSDVGELGTDADRWRVPEGSCVLFHGIEGKAEAAWGKSSHFASLSRMDPTYISPQGSPQCAKVFSFDVRIEQDIIMRHFSDYLCPNLCVFERLGKPVGGVLERSNTSSLHHRLISSNLASLGPQRSHAPKRHDVPGGRSSTSKGAMTHTPLFRCAHERLCFRVALELTESSRALAVL